jgi:membrane-associated phospholipid phosphatase
MAFSRMYLGVHYLSDVVVGAASGTALAMAYRWLLRTGAGLLRRRLR